MTSRRTVLTALAGAAIAAATGAGAQPRPLRVAWLHYSTAGGGGIFLEALRRGFRDIGYVDGTSLIIDPYWADESPERLREVIAKMIASKPHVIVSIGFAVNGVHAAKATQPVVFGYSGDPVEAGFVQSFANPGGNMTGISFLTVELVGKRIEMMKAVLPNLRRIAIVAAPQHPGDNVERRASEAAAASLGLATTFFEARSATELATALAAVEKSSCDGVVIFPVQYVVSETPSIAAWAVHNRIPTVSGWAQFAEGGNLMSYGPSLTDSASRLAYFVDRIVKGTKPAVIPVELPTRVEFVINQKAAKALGVNVPPAVVLRADRVIT